MPFVFSDGGWRDLVRLSCRPSGLHRTRYRTLEWLLFQLSCSAVPHTHLVTGLTACTALYVQYFVHHVDTVRSPCRPVRRGQRNKWSWMRSIGSIGPPASAPYSLLVLSSTAMPFVRLFVATPVSRSWSSLPPSTGCAGQGTAKLYCAERATTVQ